jgi:hypothetical protein
VEQSRKNPPLEGDEIQLSCEKSTIITGNDIYSRLYGYAVLQNGKIPKYSSTIQRDIILLPEFENKKLVKLLVKVSSFILMNTKHKFDLTRIPKFQCFPCFLLFRMIQKMTE